MLLRHFCFPQVGLDTTKNWRVPRKLTESSDWTPSHHHKCPGLRQWKIQLLFLRMTAWPIKIIALTPYSCYSTGIFHVCISITPRSFLRSCAAGLPESTSLPTSVFQSSVKPVKIPIYKPYTQKFSFIGWMLEVIGWRHFKLHWNGWSPKSVLVSCFKAFFWEGWNGLS